MKGVVCFCIDEGCLNELDMNSSALQCHSTDFAKHPVKHFSQKYSMSMPEMVFIKTLTNTWSLLQNCKTKQNKMLSQNCLTLFHVETARGLILTGLPGTPSPSVPPPELNLLTLCFTSVFS